MLDRIVAVEPRPDYHVRIRFEDGEEDEAEFRKVYIDEDSGTLAWPGGLYVAPDGLRRRLAAASSKASG